MKTINISNANIRIYEDCHIFDDGSIEHVEIDINTGIRVEYCFINISEHLSQKYSRHIAIH